MGKQFQIYLLPSDAITLLIRLRQKVDIRMLASRSVGQDPVEIESPVQTDGGIPRVECLLVPDLSVRIKLDYIENQDHWSVNTLCSEVVEVSGCHFDEKTLKRGRFFYDSGFYNASHWADKSPRFLEWSETLFRAAKKSLKRVSSLDAYVGEDADHWLSTGGIFVRLAIKGQPPLIAT